MGSSLHSSMSSKAGGNHHWEKELSVQEELQKELEQQKQDLKRELLQLAKKHDELVRKHSDDEMDEEDDTGRRGGNHNTGSGSLHLRAQSFLSDDDEMNLEDDEINGNAVGDDKVILNMHHDGINGVFGKDHKDGLDDPVVADLRHTPKRSAPSTKPRSPNTVSSIDSYDLSPSLDENDDDYLVNKTEPAVTEQQSPDNGRIKSKSGSKSGSAKKKKKKKKKSSDQSSSKRRGSTKPKRRHSYDGSIDGGGLAELVKARREYRDRAGSCDELNHEGDDGDDMNKLHGSFRFDRNNVSECFE